MNKKTIIIILAAIVVVGGVYYGVNRWRQQQLANQILKGMYGVDAGLLGKITGGGGNITNQIAQEMAKEAAKDEAQQKEDEAKEAAKTPEDRYDEIEEAETYDADSKAAVSETKKIVEKVFGKAKLTSIYTSAYGSEDVQSSMMEFEISRLVTGADLGALNKALTDKGLPIIQSSISDKTAMVVAGNNETTMYSFGFEIDGQTVGVNIMKTNQ